MLGRRWLKLVLIAVGLSVFTYAGYRLLCPPYSYDGNLGPKPSREEVLALIEQCHLTEKNWRLPADFTRKDALAVCELALRLASGDPEGARVCGIDVREDWRLGDSVASVCVGFSKPLPGIRDGLSYGLRRRGRTWRVEYALPWHYDR